MNAGLSWENISDGFFETGSIGSIDVADSDPNVIYVGTGQSTIRGNVSTGKGVYKSIDGGKTWSPWGCARGTDRHDHRPPARTRISFMRGVVGHAFGPNEERGVFRTAGRRKDLGKSPLYQPQNRHRGPGDGSRRTPGCSTPPPGRSNENHWTIISGERGVRPLQDDRRRRDVEKARQRAAARASSARSESPCLRPNPSRLWALVEAEKGGPLPVGRRRSELAAPGNES